MDRGGGSGRHDGTLASEPKWGYNHPDTTRYINCDVYNLADTLSDSPGNAADGWKTINYRGNLGRAVEFGIIPMTE